MEFVSTALSTFTTAVLSPSTLFWNLIWAVARLVIGTVIGGPAAKGLALAWREAGSPSLRSYSGIVGSWFGDAGLLALDGLSEFVLSL